MCGITGFFSFQNSGNNFQENLQESVRSLLKRGPDNQGFFFDETAFLGHARLSILDISPAGNQPMESEDGSHIIVYNGEVFNFHSLREELREKGFRFNSDTDTEVILRLYVEEGPAFLSRLNGFFSIAIYNKIEKTLFLARDRMGIKPLLLFEKETGVFFASELKALLEWDIPVELDYTSLLQFLQFNYLPGPAGILKGVRRLQPGSYLLIDKEGKKTETIWYQIPEEVLEPAPSYEAAQMRLKELLDDSVRSRLISDVPLGAFLSGGIDSSVVVALASRHTNHLKTFSIGFKDEPFFDETRYAELVAKKFKTEHTVFSLKNDDLFDAVFQVLDYIDEPFADSSAIGVYILSRETRKHVTVALSGDGADEMFSGYNKHAAEFRAQKGGLPAFAVKAGQPLWKILPKSRQSRFGNLVRQLDRFASALQQTPSERYWTWAGLAAKEEAQSLLSEKIKSQLKAEKEEYSDRKKKILRHFSKKSGINQVLLTDMDLVLPGDMLTKVDLMSMANSLEVRVPFLDYRVVDFVFSLPEEYKINASIRKRILQDAFREELPEELYKRPKHGFEVPLLKWFQTGLKPLIDELLSEQFLEQQGIFSPKAISALRQRLFSSNPGEVTGRIWALIVFQYWYKRYFLRYRSGGEKPN